MKIKFLVNPRAGQGQGRQYYTEIVKWSREIVKKGGVEVSVSLTTKSGEKNATALSRQAVKDGYERVIAVGGDGTVNEVVNGLVGANVIFGIIPAGGANDFAVALNIPENLQKALDVVIKDKIIPVDLGQVNDRYFVNVFSLGLDVMIHQLAQELKREHQLWSNDNAYWIASFKTLFSRLNYLEARVYLLGPNNNLKEIRGRATLIAVTNTPGYARILKMAPRASFRDGFLDFCWIDKIAKRKILTAFIRTINGIHTRMAEVKIFKTSLLTIFSSEAIISQVDGEILPARKEFRVRVIPGALKVLVPR